ncbi:MAG: STAS domain-containing protein [Actinomycetales bacterium]
MIRQPSAFTGDDTAFFNAFVVRNHHANVLWLEGVVDLACQEWLASTAALLQRDPKPVIIDLSRVTFSDCTLTNLIADLQRQRRVQLREPSRLVLDLLAVAGLAGCQTAAHHEELRRWGTPSVEAHT